MAEAIISSKGQVTIPKEIREKYGLEKGRRIAFIPEHGEVVLVPTYKNPVARMLELRQLLRFSDSEIKAMIKEGKKEWSHDFS
ncbi:AbrB/MazE/SpoVT family DNA-binding domain-containing protein [Candidatus Woesearchaeota archaeon]|nr:AbrB/MazE/SpoVT family DNA-binding domain-containing protein [Candidatus Woesearchaeota archaeon]